MQRFIYILLLCVMSICIACQKKHVGPSRHLAVNFQEGDLPSLHPHDLVIYLRGLSLAKMLFEPLTRINQNGEVELAGAKSVHLSSDHLTYTFILRDHAWS